MYNQTYKHTKPHTRLRTQGSDQTVAASDSQSPISTNIAFTGDVISTRSARQCSLVIDIATGIHLD